MHYLQTGQPVHSGDASTSDATDEDARVESLNVTLTHWFNKYRSLRCFLVVDPSQRDLNSDDGEDKASFANLPRADVVIHHDAFPEAHLPYLLELDLSTSAGIDALAQSARIAVEDRRLDSMAEGLGQRVGGWLASSASLDQIAAHWSRLILQRDESGRACVLRLYDTRALALLWTVLSQAQQQAILGPVRAWHVLDAAARPTVHQATSDSQKEFLLSAAQWEEIHRHGLVNRALALHAQTCGRQPQPDEIEAAVAAAARADRYKLLDRDDRTAFIGHALAWHPQFDLHPKVSQLLGRRKEDDFYTAEVAQLSADDITQIRQADWYEPLSSSASR